MEAARGGRCFVVLCVAMAAVLASLGGGAVEAAAAQELRRGFSAAHDRSYSQFEQVLSDPTGVFALGFLRINSTMLDLAVLHLPSSFPLWRAIPDSPAQWSAPVSLSFDGDLVLTDPAANKVLWSAAAAAGDRVVLLNTSNLQIQSDGGGGSLPGIMWQSFDTPSETIVQGQNLTSAAALYTFDRRFSMRMGTSYFGLYIEPPASSSGGGVAAAMYWKHTALQAKAEIVDGGGPTYARVEPDGYLAMYQKEGPPADVLSFDTFNHGVRALRRMTLEADGNLRAYYWDSTRSRWVLDYTAITDPCGLPTTCGAYAVCVPPSGRCACLANATDGSGCAAASVGGGLCGRTGGEVGGLYWEVRRQRVEPANKELLPFEHSPSAADCEARCARNCSCWGSVYSNGTGYCYLMDYPAQMMVAADERKVGYFKVRSLEEAASSGGGRRAAGVKAALLAVGVTVLVAAAAFGAYRVWKRRCRAAVDARRQVVADDEGLSPGPYKNLGSFSSVELSSSFRR
uniref:non-specific serine/threonine protein kinase n=1 Tax=Oryza punctata TaxID=4537 RepID=A0A0E0K0K1_ORYPU